MFLKISLSAKDLDYEIRHITFKRLHIFVKECKVSFMYYKFKVRYIKKKFFNCLLSFKKDNDLISSS